MNDIKETIENSLKRYETGLSRTGITYSFFEHNNEKGFRVTYKDISGNIFFSSDDTVITFNSLITYSDRQGRTGVFVLENTEVGESDYVNIDKKIFDFVNKIVGFKNNMEALKGNLIDILETIKIVNLDFSTFLKMNDKSINPD